MKNGRTILYYKDKDQIEEGVRKEKY